MIEVRNVQFSDKQFWRSTFIGSWDIRTVEDLLEFP